MGIRYILLMLIYCSFPSLTVFHVLVRAHKNSLRWSISTKEAYGVLFVLGHYKPSMTWYILQSNPININDFFQWINNCRCTWSVYSRITWSSDSVGCQVSVIGVCDEYSFVSLTRSARFWNKDSVSIKRSMKITVGRAEMWKRLPLYRSFLCTVMVRRSSIYIKLKVHGYVTKQGFVPRRSMLEYLTKNAHQC